MSTPHDPQEPSEVAKAATGQIRLCGGVLIAIVIALVLRGLLTAGGGDDLPELPESLPETLPAATRPVDSLTWPMVYLG